MTLKEIEELNRKAEEVKELEKCVRELQKGQMVMYKIMHILQDDEFIQKVHKHAIKMAEDRIKKLMLEIECVRVGD